MSIVKFPKDLEVKTVKKHKNNQKTAIFYSFSVKNHHF